jgi:hypothetical protein
MNANKRETANEQPTTGSVGATSNGTIPKLTNVPNQISLLRS